MAKDWPKAMQALSVRAQGLSPGQARAYYYWLCSLQARNTRMRSSQKVTLRTGCEDLDGCFSQIAGPLETFLAR